MIQAEASIDKVRAWVAQAQRVVVLTGAGISTESGIPDFRGPQGVWTRDPEAEKLSNIRYYMADAQIRKKAWQQRLVHPAWEARPNAGHEAIVGLERRGKLHALITQNIDELHRIAGNSPGRIIEVHGTMRRATRPAICTKATLESWPFSFISTVERSLSTLALSRLALKNFPGR